MVCGLHHGHASMVSATVPQRPVPPTSGPLPGGRRARPVLSAPGPAGGRASEHPRSSRPEDAAPHSGDCRFLRSRGQQSAQKRSASSAQDSGSCSHLPTQQSEPLAWPGPKASRAPRPPAQPQGQPQRRRPPRTSLLLRLLSPPAPPSSVAAPSNPLLPSRLAHGGCPKPVSRTPLFLRPP